jgi:AcrR family transcriptional regulator
MSKGEQTREMILSRSAQVFNRRGYFGASLADIMRETGLEKGGIYNHFTSKDQLALEAFDYAFGLVQQRVLKALDGKRHAIDRLLALTQVFYAMAETPSIDGGCPVLNTAIESDDTHPALRDRAREAMQQWFDMLRRIAIRGVERDELRSDVDPDELASVFVAMVEGGAMMTKLHHDIAHMRRVTKQLEAYVVSLRKEN